MPAKSEAQERLMEAAAHTKGGYGGVPQSVGKEFVDSTEKCAGILFLCGDNVLLLHRTDRDEWEGPGGHLEAGETAEQAAVRETWEEAGIRVSPSEMVIDGEKGIYTTFIVHCGEQFRPILNHEHNESGWFPMSGLPKSAHPDIHKWAETAFSRSDSIGESTVDKVADGNVTTEMDVAKGIRDGLVESPASIGNAWLFDIRISGTGISYRPQLDEYVFRPPEFYLCDDFLERCNGLSVIFDHPVKGMLNTDEYRNRSIGSIILPYIPTGEDDKHSPTEVWGIARIYDRDAAELMMTTHISTSPGVTFDKDNMTYMRTDDGSRLLLEGKPKVLDHIAVCEAGVWDKRGEPQGVNNG